MLRGITFLALFPSGCAGVSLAAPGSDPFFVFFPFQAATIDVGDVPTLKSPPHR